MDSPIEMDDLDDYVRKMSFISWIYSISISHMVAYIPYKMGNSYGYPHDLGNLPGTTPAASLAPSPPSHL